MPGPYLATREVGCTLCPMPYSPCCSTSIGKILAGRPNTTLVQSYVLPTGVHGLINIACKGRHVCCTFVRSPAVKVMPIRWALLSGIIEALKALYAVLPCPCQRGVLPGAGLIAPALGLLLIRDACSNDIFQWQSHTL